ncbi:MAG: hypothetical protein ABFD66_15570 [Smithella sp.]
MGNITYDSMRKRIEEYFANITDEEFCNDVENTGFDFYKNVKEVIFSEPSEGVDIAYFYQSYLSPASWLGTQTTRGSNVISVKVGCFSELSTPDEYDDYQIAA